MLLQEWTESFDVQININRITKMGDWQPVTEHGKLIIWKAFAEKGVLRDQPLYLHQLPANELVLKDGQAEYQMIDGNHCLTII